MDNANIANISAAFVAAQAEIKPAVKDCENPHLRNKYADFTSVWGAIQPALIKNNLAVYQPVKETPGYATVETFLMHSSGEVLSLGTVTLPVGEAKGISPAQAAGLAITYARRYGLSSAFCVCTEDDDGNCGGDPRQYAPQQDSRAVDPKLKCKPCGSAMSNEDFMASTKKFGEPICRECAGKRSQKPAGSDNRQRAVDVIKRQRDAAFANDQVGTEAWTRLAASHGFESMADIEKSDVKALKPLSDALKAIIEERQAVSASSDPFKDE